MGWHSLSEAPGQAVCPQPGVRGISGFELPATLAALSFFGTRPAGLFRGAPPASRACAPAGQPPAPNIAEKPRKAQ